MKNILHCLTHGTQMGWLIDPDEELVFVYLAHDSTDQLAQPRISVFETKDDLLPVPEFAKSFQLTIGQLFDWLAD